MLFRSARESSDRRKAGRLMKVFGVIRELTRRKFDEGEKIAQALKLSQDEQLATERAIADNLRRLTEEREPTSPARLVAGEWPPVIPVGRMVERFTGIAIGLHAENPRTPLTTCVAAAFEEAVAPALAWGLMINLYALPEELRQLTQQKLAELIASGREPHCVEIQLEGEAYRKVPLTYLRMVEAWFRLFGQGKLCGMKPEETVRLRGKLAGLAAQPLEDLDTLLWKQLGGLYISTLNGSERARAVAKASGHAAFARERLALFESAMRDDLQDFRLRTEQRLDEAAQQAFACDDENPVKPIEAGIEACGAAFWLARACFDKHNDGHADEASNRVVDLLLRAAKLLEEQPDQAAACLRYAAGFATNPRYARSEHVMHAQRKLVDLYAGSHRPRRALVEQFRGRIAWQDWQAGLKPAKETALAHYANALHLHDKGGDGLDAEGPIHFFPELIVLLSQAAARGEREQANLAAVDFITQRNYGIYFDIDRERALLGAGLNEYKTTRRHLAKEFLRSIREATAKRQAAVLAAAAQADAGQDEAADEEALQSNWEEVSEKIADRLRKSHPAKYRALMRQLFG